MVILMTLEDTVICCKIHPRQLRPGDLFIRWHNDGISSRWSKLYVFLVIEQNSLWENYVRGLKEGNVLLQVLNTDGKTMFYEFDKSDAHVTIFTRRTL